MSAAARVRALQGRLIVLAIVRAALWAAAVLLIVLAVAAALGAHVPMPLWTRTAAPGLAAFAAFATAATALWRERFLWSLPHVALWVEERTPALQYALVTAVDPRYAVALGPSLEPMIAEASQSGAVRLATRRSLLPALIALAIAGVAFAAVPRGWKGSVSTPESSGGAPAARAMGSRLAPLAGSVTPPAYAAEAGVKAQSLHEPTTIAGLAGSKVELNGPGAADGVEAQLADSAVAVTATPDGWRVTFTLPDSATALRLVDRTYRRLIVLAPQRDELPVVQLVAPARDTTLREPTGSLRLDARLADDFGLASARFEYIISSGESEGNFTFRQGTLGARKFTRTRGAQLQLTVPLSQFKLQPGDQLSIRAAATDINTLSGPGVGYSESRLVRIARPGEYDSLAVEGAPPPADTALTTLRYIIQLTEELHQQRKKIPRKEFVSRSRTLSDQVGRLRARVQELQSERTLGGMLPPNSLLATAYLALAEGGGALGVAEPGDALPHLWKALKALQKFALTERYYLRGKQPQVLVDLARVRLTGTDTGHATARPPRREADSAHASLRDAYAAAVHLLGTSRDSAVERLLALQAEALRTEPALAGALGAAVAAVRGGGDPTGPLQQARQLLDGRPAVTDTLPRWSGAW